MKSTQEILDKLITHCFTRGAAAQLARDLDVAKSTITRWLDEKTIPDTMQKLLAWYLFGEAPPSLVQSCNLKDSLLFDDVEWRIISHLARREGITEAQWITGRIRSYLAYQDAPIYKVAEDTPVYRADAPMTSKPIFVPARPVNYKDKPKKAK